ncbi:hypothetical protein [Deinococcus sp.]|uniref:hypothetical protein n=1 Tax=Deinococcus sp. TaxID=47478 RepID=UPI003C7A9162
MTAESPARLPNRLQQLGVQSVDVRGSFSRSPIHPPRWARGHGRRSRLLEVGDGDQRRLLRNGAK